MGDTTKLEERIEKREKRIEKLETSLKEEKRLLKRDNENLVHLKYDDVLRQMHETGLSPDEALRALQAIDSETQNNQSNNNQGGTQNHERNF